MRSIIEISMNKGFVGVNNFELPKDWEFIELTYRNGVVLLALLGDFTKPNVSEKFRWREAGDKIEDSEVMLSRLVIPGMPPGRYLTVERGVCESPQDLDTPEADPDPEPSSFRNPDDAPPAFVVGRAIHLMREVHGRMMTPAFLRKRLTSSIAEMEKLLKELKKW